MKLKFVLSVLFLLTISNSFSQENLLTSLTIPENLSKNANAVIRLNKVDVTIESQSKIKTSITRIVTVLNEKGDRNILMLS